MSRSAVAEPNDSPGGPPGLGSEGSDSARSTATARSAALSASACPIGTSCESALVDIRIEPRPERPWQVLADDAEATDQRGEGSYGVLTGNWGHLVQKKWTEHRNKDLLSGPYHILALQEADAELHKTLTGEASISEQAAEQSREDRQGRPYIAVLGELAPGETTLLCAVRTSLFSRIGVLLFERIVEP